MEKTPISSGDSSIPLKTSVVTELATLNFCKDTLSDLEPAISSAELVCYEPGDTLFNAGDEVEVLIVIKRGRVKLLDYSENGRARIVRLHQRGSTLGLNALVDIPHAHTAVAVDRLEVYSIPISAIKLLEKNTAGYCQLLEYWYDYLALADTWITEFSTGAIRGRVARLILFLIESEGVTMPNEVILLTVEEMADTLGVTPESVSRVMADFKRKKFLVASDYSHNYGYKVDLSAIEQEAQN